MTEEANPRVGATTKAESVAKRIVNLIPSEPGTQIKRSKVSDIQCGLYETSAHPVGNWRTSWIMQLRRNAGKCKVPRGFGDFYV